MYRSAYYPHNIHFVLVSAQMGGDGPTAIDAAGKLDASLSDTVIAQFAVLEPIKAAPYLAHALFSAPDTILALKTPPKEQVLVSALAHYARALAFAAKKDATGAQREIDAISAIRQTADFKPYTDWAVPGKEIVQTASLVARARLADAQGDLPAAAKAYEEAIAIEDALAYMEPPFWYYPIRQSLGSVYLRQGKLDEAENAGRPGGSLQAQGRHEGRGLGASGLCACLARRRGARYRPAVGSSVDSRRGRECQRAVRIEGLPARPPHWIALAFHLDLSLHAQPFPISSAWQREFGLSHFSGQRITGIEPASS
jgi:hypothetical protein